MSTTEKVKELLNDHQFTKAFVLDDAYDSAPDFSQLIPLVGPDLADLVPSLDTEIIATLNEVLEEIGLETDDWEGAISEEKFLRALWDLRAGGKLSDPVIDSSFGVYLNELESKKHALQPLLTFLKEDLGLSISKSGRESHSLPADTKLVFLDLFLGITDDDSAREEAADKIKELLKDISDRDRPVVVLMSSKTGEELEKMAEVLRSRAGLMGAKFRVLSKTEFGRENAIGTVLLELLGPLSNANTLAELIDSWDGTLKYLRDTLKSDLRALDLSDYAFLAKYRLEVENMPLGSYLLEVYGDVLRYRLEGHNQLREATAKIDALDFTELPPAHFLPQSGVNLLSHAVSFVNDNLIRQEGYQFTEASAKLQLGDLLVSTADWNKLTAISPTVSVVPIQVVISQACDLQQGKSEEIFLLEGKLSPRDWTESIKALDTRIDCFLWEGREYSINWNEGKLKTWGKKLANNKLAPGKGSHQRIARLRPLAALKAQQLFASRLTRVGTLASPHGVAPAILRVDYLTEQKERRELFTADELEKLACVVNGAVFEGTPKYSQYLVFARNMPRILASKLLEVVDEMHPSVRADVRDFAQSELALAPLRQPCKVGGTVDHKTLKLEMRMTPITSKAHVGIMASIPVGFSTKLAGQL